MNSVCVVKEAVRELIFTLVASLLCLCPIAAQAYSGGAGTEIDPYQIANKADLLYLGTNTADYTKHFIMTADIDLAGEVFDRAVIATDTVAGNYGFDGSPFEGKFDGDGHLISNLRIEGAVNNGYLGLFGFLKGSVSRLGLEHVDISTSKSFGRNVGGLCGANYGGVISECYVTGEVLSSSNAGGLCGYNYSGTIVDSFAHVNVDCGMYAGGMCGSSYYGLIERCFSTGRVSFSEAPSVGGFCGLWRGVGGICPIVNCFWDYQSCGLDQLDSAGGIGKTTVEMQSLATYSGWNFSSVWRMKGYPVLKVFDPGADVTLSSLSISGPSWIMQIDSTNYYDCAATYSDGRCLKVAAGLTWSVDNDEAEIDEHGVLRASGVEECNTLTVGVSYTEQGVTVSDSVVIAVVGPYSGGSGVESDPYRISDARALLNLRVYPNDYNKCFVMTRDIDLNGMVLDTPLIPADTEAWYDDSGVWFTGVFDGGGFVISNFTVNIPENEFGGSFVDFIGSGGVVENLGVEASVSAGEHSFKAAGGLCGFNRGVISNCFFRGSVISGNYKETAGLCGYNEGLIRDSFSTGLVRNTLAGAGGLCGGNRGSIYRCWSSCDVFSGESGAGGLCVGNYGKINECFSTGRVEGYALVGGLCGVMVDGSICDSYATGEVVGQQIVGGFFGGIAKGNGVISNCYSIGGVSGISSSGGFCARPEGVVVDNCYFYLWSGLANGLGVALEQGELAVADSYAGFDFSGTSVDGTNDLWTIVDGHSPKLSWQAGSGPDIPACTKPETTLAGQGVADDPFIIADLIDLYEFSENPNLDRGYFKLISNLNLAGTNFNASFIDREFGGVFDGNGHRIQSMRIAATNSTDNQLGFFADIVGSVYRLGLENVQICGGSEVYYVGALCGINGGAVNECFASGSVEGRYSVGGFCGQNAGDIRNSHSSVNVVGLSGVGGFCGVGGRYPLGFFANCYATGSVAGNADFGGFGGIIFDESVSATNCFWDVQSSGTAASSGGIGKTTAEMQSQATFTDAGWNFADVWGMSGYPVLRVFRHTLQVDSGTGQGEYALEEEIVVCADAAPVGYEFRRWNIDPPEYSNNLSSVSAVVAAFVMPYADVVLSADYSILRYDVVFDIGAHGVHAGGGALAQVVEHGSAATAPAVQAHVGWRFVGWDAAYDNIASNTVVAALYLPAVTGVAVSGPASVDELSSGEFVCIAAFGDGSTAEVTAETLWSLSEAVPEVSIDGGVLAVGSIESDSQATVVAEYNDQGVLFTNALSVAINNLPYGGGTGTDADPHKLATKADLLSLAVATADYGKHFLLIDTIDLTGEVFASAVIASTSSPLFFNGIKFNGKFDGGGHAILGMSIDSPDVGNDYLGLFGHLDAGAVVCNLTVSGATITGKAGGSLYIGALCGYANGAVISNCSARAELFGDDYIGVLAGRVKNSVIVFCSSSGSAAGDNYVGGLCGRVDSGMLASAYSSASVAGDSYVGGLAGYLYQPAVADCYACGSVVGDGYSGGFAGRVNSATVQNCFWDNQTSGYASSAGAAGRTTAAMQTQTTFTDAGWNFADVWYMDGYPALRCFNPPGTYGYWLMDAGIPSALRGRNDIPADDGVANLLKYACALPAMAAATTADLMTIEPIASSMFSVLYYKSKTARDVTLRPIWAESLHGPWSTLGFITEKVDEDGVREQWRASVPMEESGFIKLRVTEE
jgi:hypothetical protein